MVKRHKPPGEVRSFGDQVEELCSEKGWLKQEVAARAEITPAQLSHYLKFGCSLRMIERIAESVGIDPSYFDVYVAESSASLIAENAELLGFMRALHRATPTRRKALLKKLGLE
jgi:transcriptional regulator with XRE-family HTH domain